MPYHSLKHFGHAPLFNSEKGITVVEPLGNDEGWWSGAPSAIYDDTAGKFYLYYRLRRPRGMNLERGGECFIAESTDGVEDNQKRNSPRSGILPIHSNQSSWKS